MTVAGCHIRKRKTGFKICLLHFESHSTLTFVTMLLVCFFDTFIFYSLLQKKKEMKKQPTVAFIAALVPLMRSFFVLML